MGNAIEAWKCRRRLSNQGLPYISGGPQWLEKYAAMVVGLLSRRLGTHVVCLVSLSAWVGPGYRANYAGNATGFLDWWLCPVWEF